MTGALIPASPYGTLRVIHESDPHHGHFVRIIEQPDGTTRVECYSCGQCCEINHQPAAPAER